MLVLKPYARPPTYREIGYVVDSERVVGEWTGDQWKDVPRKAALYANDARGMRALYQRGECEAIYWKKAARVRSLTGWKWYHPSGHTVMVYYIKGTLSKVPEAERLAALLAFVGHVRSIGGSVSSPVGMLNSLLRVSLPHAFTESSDEVPTGYIWRGSRVQQANRVAAEYGPTDLWDMRSAFPSALASTYVPRKWREYECKPNGELPDVPSGYAWAYVRVPWMMYGPLPDVMLHHPNFPTECFLHGVWSFDELNAAREVGCDVFPVRYWVGSSYRQPFAEWGRMVNELRGTIDRNAVGLVKLAANRYVGRFAMEGHRERSFIDKTGKERWIVEKGQHRPDSLTVHGLVTANVRSRLFLEGIYPYPAHFVFAHTDGVALDATFEELGYHPPTPKWQAKAYMEKLLLINPQRYAYVPAADDLEPGDWRYIIAGIPEESGEGFFHRRWDRTLKVPGPPTDTV